MIGRTPLWLPVILLGALLAYLSVPYAGVLVVIGVILFAFWMWERYGRPSTRT